MKYIEKSDGFFVDEEGNVYRHGKKLNPHSSGAGDKYYRQRIYNLDGTVYRKDIHRLVAELFLDNPDKLPVVNHKNGLKRDNRVSNLEWCTQAHNNRHAFEYGLNKNYLEDHHSAQLTNEQVHEICKLLQDGWRNCDIASLYDVSKAIPCNIRNGISWVEISSQYNVRKQRRQRASLETIHWICKCMQDGLTNKEIKDLATTSAVTACMLCDIRARRRWTQVSSAYSF